MHRFRGWQIVVFLLAFAAMVACTERRDGSGAAPSEQENLEGNAASAAYEDIPVGFTEDGHPYRGQPDAPLTIVEFSDYLCPFCGRHFSETMPALMDEYVRTGEVRYVFRDFPIESLHPTADLGHEAALCVGDQSAALYWQYHDQLFARQAEWNRLADPRPFLAEMAEQLGADMGGYQECMASEEKSTLVDASIQEGFDLGYNGTPSFQVISSATNDTYALVGAQPFSNFSAWIDSLAEGEEPPIPPTPAPPRVEMPYWGDVEGFAPDPDRPGFNKAGDQYKGDPDADVVVVQFSDFQCPPCRSHALDVQPLIDAEFVDTGQIMWVNKHLPLPEHQQSVEATVTAECAAEQGMYWQMHDLLYEQVERWATENARSALFGLASEIDLDMSAFEACYEGKDAIGRVLDDMRDAHTYVSVTPSFLVIRGDRVSAYRGGASFDRFSDILRASLTAQSDAE